MSAATQATLGESDKGIGETRLRRLAVGLAVLGALAICLAPAAGADAPTAWSANSIASQGGGSKVTPAPFNATWTVRGDAGEGIRPSTTSVWTWSWEGVTVNQKGLPTFLVKVINAARTETVCPSGSKVGEAPTMTLSFGPTDSPSGPNTSCLGKRVGIYNGPPGQLVFAIDGPPEQCVSLGFLTALPVILGKARGRTTMSLELPENLRSPFAGTSSAISSGSFALYRRTLNGRRAQNGKGKKASQRSFLTSAGCTRKRTFHFNVVDSFGPHEVKSSAGPCKPPKNGKTTKRNRKRKG
jgi:hypothetical protein